jgi:Uma2 family endonuclease
VTSAATKRVSEAEFLALPESNRPTELLDGEVIVAPSPSFWHQEVLTRLVQRLRQWASGTEQAFQVCQAPLDVRFGPDRILQPDAFVLPGALPRDHQGPITTIPLLCVEVLSAERVYDRITKRFVYAAAGVPEYWVVSPGELVEKWSGPGLDRYEQVTDRLRSSALPGLETGLSELFG